MTENTDTPFDLNFPRALGHPENTVTLRKTPEDFIVDEIVDWEPSGEGEHFLLHIRKKGANTGWVAEQFANLAGIRVMDVGFCGLKDRHAVTTQWFSLYLPKQEPDWQSWDIEGVDILRVARHKQKLRRGSHSANSFKLRLRELDGDVSDLENRLETIKAQGVPNYFGEQRFGRNGNNLSQALTLFRQEGKRRKNKKIGMYLSSARSWLFNQVLAERVKKNTWKVCLEGDVPGVSSDGSAQKQNQATGPLWGRGRSLVSGETEALETTVLSNWLEWCDGLEHSGLSQERKALQLTLNNFSWTLIDNGGEESVLELSFELPVGAFATSVVREIALTR